MAYLGDIIDGKYEILREIGRGGMSVVYLAMDKRLDKLWAIKEFRKDKDDDSNKIALEALLKEASIMKKLDHPTLPRIVNIIDEDNTIYVVMDYIEGESLNKVLDAYGAQPQDAVIEWAKQLSEVLDYLHTREPAVIYRDMKPANIMLKPDGTIRLIDFGIAREYKKGNTGDTENIGTRGYAAPEQFNKQSQTDARTDIYSLGVTLYHLVTGKNPSEPPYELYPIRHWNPKLSTGLEWVIQKCTQLNPSDRFQTCAEITYVLNNLDKFETDYKKKLRKKLGWFIGAVSATLACAIVGGSMAFITFNNHTNEMNRLKAEGTISGYIAAIQLDSSDYDAYNLLLDKIDIDIDTILPGDVPADQNTETLHNNRQMYYGELQKAISTETLAKLQAKNPSQYVDTSYKLGLLMLNHFSDSSDGSGDRKFSSFEYAMPYFARVITGVQQEGGSYMKCGLEQEQYQTAVYYYLLTYFKQNEKKFSESQLNEMGKFVASDLVSYLCSDMGYDYLNVEEDGSINRYYEAFWQLITRSTADTATNLKLSPKANLNLVQFNTHTMIQLKDKFFKLSEKKDNVTLRSPLEVEPLYSNILTVYNDAKKTIEDQELDENSELFITLDSKLKKTAESVENFRDNISAMYDKYKPGELKLEKL